MPFFGIENIYKRIREFYQNFQFDEMLWKVLNNLKSFNLALEYIKNELDLFEKIDNKQDYIIQAEKKAKILVKRQIVYSSFVGLVPIPFADIPVLLGIQTKLIIEIASLFGCDIKDYSLRDLMLTHGTGSFFRIGTVLGTLLKLAQLGDIIPLLGPEISSITNMIDTKVLGKNTINFFKNEFFNKRGNEPIINRVKKYENIFDQFNFRKDQNAWENIEYEL